MNAQSLAFYIARMGTFYGSQLERFGYGDAVAAVRARMAEEPSVRRTLAGPPLEPARGTAAASSRLVLVTLADDGFALDLDAQPLPKGVSATPRALGMAPGWCRRSGWDSFPP